MKVAFISEAAPTPKESGQAAGTQSNPGEFSLAMAAVLALLQTNPVNLPSAENGGGGETLPGGSNCKSCLTPTPLPGIAPETSICSVLRQDSTAIVETDSISDIKKSVEQLPCPKTPAELNLALENSVKEGTVTVPVGGGVPEGVEPTGAMKEPVAFSGNASGSLFGEALGGNVLNPERVNSSVVSAKVDSSVASELVKENAPGRGNNCVPPEGSTAGKPAFAPQKESVAVQTAIIGEDSSTPGNSGMAVVEDKSGVKAVANGKVNSLKTNSPEHTQVITKNAPIEPGEKGILAAGDTVGAGGKETVLVPEKGGTIKPRATGEVEVKAHSGGVNKSVENNPNTTQVNVITPASTSGENSVALPGLRERLVQEIRHIYINHKGEPLTQVQLKLEPEHLGRLTIKLVFKEGELNAHFYTGNSYVKDILEGSFQQLRESLSQQDLKLNQAFVYVGNDGGSHKGSYFESGNRRMTPVSGSYGGQAYGETRVEPTGFVLPGDVSLRVNYLI